MIIQRALVGLPLPRLAAGTSSGPVDRVGSTTPTSDLSMEDARRVLFGSKHEIGLNWIKPIEANPSRHDSQEQPAYSFATMPDGTVVINGTRGTHAYRADGSEAWHLPTGYCPSPPALQPDGRVFVNSKVDLNDPDRPPMLHVARDSGQGMQIEWSQPLDTGVFFTPTVGSDGRLFTASSNRMFIHQSDGKDAGPLEQEGISPNRPVVLPDGRVLLHATTNVLLVNPSGSDGRPRVEQVYECSKNWPILTEKDGTTYFWDDRHLRCMEADLKTQRWEYDFGENGDKGFPQIRFGPDHSVYALRSGMLSGSELTILNARGEFHAKWQPTGGLDWMGTTPHLGSPPIIDDSGAAYFGGDKWIYAVDANGRDMWDGGSVKYEESCNELSLGPHGTLVVSSPSTRLRVVSCKDGAQLWSSKFEMGHGYPSTAVVGDTIYAASKDCQLASIHCKDVLLQVLDKPEEAVPPQPDASIEREPHFVIIDGVRVPVRASAGGGD